MKRILFAAALLACCFVLEAANPGATLAQANRSRVQTSDVSKASATVDVVPGQPRVIVRITNSANVPLEAWSVRLSYQPASGKTNDLEYTSETSFAEAPVGTPGQGPIQPGETREERITIGTVPVSASVAVQMVLFSDLTAQGSVDEVDAALGRRERYADTLQVWIDALNAASRKTAPEAKAVLQKVLDSEKHRGDNSESLAISAQEKMAALIRTDDSPPGWSDRVTELKQCFERQRVRALRHQKAR